MTTPSAARGNGEGGASRPKQKRTKLTYNDKRELDELTKAIPRLERQRVELASSLDQAAGNYERTVALASQLATAIETLDRSETRWLELTEKAEGLRAED